MIPTSPRFIQRWKSGVFGSEFKAHLLFPTPVTSAISTVDVSPNFPPSAVMDNDRTTLNAGPAVGSEYGYGPANNYVGKGLWMSGTGTNWEVTKTAVDDWLGIPYLTSGYEAVLAQFGPSFNWRMDDVGPAMQSPGTWYCNPPPVVQQNAASLNTGGRPPMLAGDQLASAEFILNSPGNDPASHVYTIMPAASYSPFTWITWIKSTVGGVLAFSTVGSGPSFVSWTFRADPGQIGVSLTWSGTTLTIIGPCNVLDGNLHMVALCHGKGFSGLGFRTELYFDGQMVGYAFGGAKPAPLAPFQIGLFTGMMSHTSFFTKVLPGSEVGDQFNAFKVLYAAGTTPITNTPDPTVLSGTSVTGNQIEMALSTPRVDEYWDKAADRQALRQYNPAWALGVPESAYCSQWRQILRSDGAMGAPYNHGGKVLDLWSDIYTASRPIIMKRTFAPTASGVHTFWLNVPQAIAYQWLPKTEYSNLSIELWEGAPVFARIFQPGQGGAGRTEIWNTDATQLNKGVRMIAWGGDRSWRLNGDPRDVVTDLNIGGVISPPAGGVSSPFAWSPGTWYKLSLTWNVATQTAELWVWGGGTTTKILTLTGLNFVNGPDTIIVRAMGEPSYTSSVPEPHYYIDELRLGSSFGTTGTWQVVLDAHGFPSTGGKFSFNSEANPIFDGVTTHRPYYSFSFEYSDGPSGPWSAPDPVYPNPGKAFSASNVLFDPGARRYIRVTVTAHADGAEGIMSNALLNFTIHFDTVGHGLIIGTGGLQVGRVCLYTDPNLGGIKKLRIQRGSTVNGPFVDVTEIEEVQAFEKWNGRALTAIAGAFVTVTHDPSYPTLSVPGAILVDWTRNFSAADASPTSYLKIVSEESGTVDGRTRVAEIELFRRLDVTSITDMVEIVHQADVALENIQARQGTASVANPRLSDGTLMFKKADFQRETSGQTFSDMTPELVVKAGHDGELVQIGWMSVDEPVITQESFTLSLTLRGRHERLLLTKDPTAFRRNIQIGNCVPLTLALCNIPEAFHALPAFTTALPVFAPEAKGWDELNWLKEAMGDPGVRFDGQGVLKTSFPAGASLDTVDENIIPMLSEHVSYELAGKTAAANAVDVDIHTVTTVNEAVYTETPQGAGAPVKTVRTTKPADPATMTSDNSPLQIVLPNPRNPRVANTQTGGYIRADAKDDSSVTTLYVNPAARQDDPNTLVRDTISNPYIVNPTQAQNAANARMAKQGTATVWSEPRCAIAPHLEIGDKLTVRAVSRNLQDDYMLRKVTTTIRVSPESASFETSLEAVKV